MVEFLSNEDVTHWLQTVTSTTATCWVENPETVKESGFMTSTTFTTYRVLLKASDGELTACRHRFSDFEALRDNLRAKYFSYGLIVPSLPPKKLTGTQDKDFLTERMQGLTLLCEEFVSYPWFRKDPLWIAFLGKEPSSASSAVAPEDMLTYMCNKMVVPKLALERLCTVKQEVLILEKKMKAVLDQVKLVQTCLKQLHAASAGLQSSFDALRASEETEIKYLNGHAEEMSKDAWSLKLRDSEKTPLVTAAIASFLSNEVTIQSPSADYLNVLFYSYLERELARCASIRELLKYHDDLSTTIDSLRVNIEKLEAKNQKASTPKIVEQIKAAKLEFDEQMLLLNTFFKGFFYFTLPLAVKGRSVNFRKMTECVAAYELVACTSQQQSVTSLMGTLKISARQAVDETRSMLKLLALPPLAALDNEENVLDDLGILPGLALKPSSDWLVELYKVYGGVHNTQSKDVEEEAGSFVDDVVTSFSSSVEVSKPESVREEYEEEKGESKVQQPPLSPVKRVVSDSLDGLVGGGGSRQETEGQRRALLFGS